ncbi:TadG family pilus assembly protein [Bordetella holmesii]|uniref:Tad-like Flp pilus-assembly family protein n=3 Tax=Bordetella holmesii TaxID=35814 RepID=A0ABN0S186_9BORD|nr:TadG family pilus assembly protein [Bordetella holmesii]AIT25487.1 tad-like Flp pilus-assembly family protein [Bordetella holmesii 44057]EWM43398.1 tad-like Flp pilus-assembly family protein [Bordetella holmesii 41130]EWM46057.1 tad-like Flp pilus-assembly family protein [Bordetella holmesii 35009]EWM50208.1 tad-like Flp pilus-assembly family protein [Bordetella holmesii 70147]KAK72322.1 putative Tad-like Flp pilus-assembly [Bordetella holmesii H620]
MVGRNRSFRQRGSILVSAALIILVGIILLGGAQLGYFYYVKRELQKAADLGALTAAQMLDGTSCTWAASAARVNVRENLSGYAQALLPTGVECYRWDPDNASLAPRFVRAPAAGERLNAVRVEVSLPVSALFPYMSSRTLQAEAVAARPAEPVASFWVGDLLPVISTKSM